MSRRGEIAIECESSDCQAEIVFAPADFYSELDAIASDHGWKRKDGKDFCPDCAKPENPREKGDDDAIEFSDPRDAREERRG